MKMFFLWLRKQWTLLRRPRYSRILVHIIYKDYKEQYRRLQILPKFLPEMRRVLFDAELVRQATIYEEQWHCHKSYMDDFNFNPEEFLALLKEEKK